MARSGTRLQEVEMTVGGVTRIVVVGGGCSGTLAAAEILAVWGDRPCDLVVVDPAETPGRGIAYATSCQSHLLNVPAEQMSAHLGRPGHFAAWAHRRDGRLTNLSFAPRMLYGDYLEAVWHEARRSAPSASSLAHRQARAIAATPFRDGSGVRVDLEDGGRINADHVVLAMGNLPPAGHAPGQSPGIAGSARYVADPWRAGALDRISGSVLLIGTGLTAVDVALALVERDIAGPIRAVSRHGLLPRAHRPDPQVVPPLSALSSERTVRSLIALLRRNAAACGDWRRAIDEFRPHVAEVWRTASEAERRRFVRHAARFWEVHRHRMAPEVADRVSHLMATHRISVRAGAIEGYHDVPGAVDVVIRRRRSTETDVVTVSHVINCTGPQLKVSDAGDPFVDSLLASGVVRPGPFGLGFDVADDGAVIDANGLRSQHVWSIGPLRRGVEWETTAAREIRSQAVALAARLSATGSHQGSPVDAEEPGTLQSRLLTTIASAVGRAGVERAGVLR
jgi:uncharacterized NAD(P)/FAD-binding protein YdhS